MSLRTILHRSTDDRVRRARTDRSLQRAMSRAVTPSSRDELAQLRNGLR